MSHAERELLAAGATELGMTLEPGQIDSLMRLVDELESTNAKFNLTAIRDRLGILQKHLLDSLTLNRFLRGTRVADVGTGPGFPGLPLAITNPQRNFSLIESTAKKARFVELASQALGCANVEVVNKRAEAYRPFELFDTVTSRALSSLADFIAYAGHLCAPDGCLLAMKGKRPDSEITLLPKSYRVRAVNRVKVPGLDDERHIVEISRA